MTKTLKALYDEIINKAAGTPMDITKMPNEIQIFMQTMFYCGAGSVISELIEAASKDSGDKDAFDMVKNWGEEIETLAAMRARQAIEALIGELSEANPDIEIHSAVLIEKNPDTGKVERMTEVVTDKKPVDSSTLH